MSLILSLEPIPDMPLSKNNSREAEEASLEVDSQVELVASQEASPLEEAAVANNSKDLIQPLERITTRFWELRRMLLKIRSRRLTENWP